MEISLGYVVVFGVVPLLAGFVLRRWAVLLWAVAAFVVVLVGDAVGGGIEPGRDWDVATTLLATGAFTLAPVLASSALGTWLGCRLSGRAQAGRTPAVS